MKKIISIILTIVMLSAVVMTIPFGTFAVEAADAVASIGTTYYEKLDDAIDAAQDGDVIVLLKDMTATSKLIEGKKITIKGEGTTKPVITAGSVKGAFWVRGDVTFENIAFKGFTSKNVIFYGTQDNASDDNTYKVTVNNCEFEFSASGAIYGYDCGQAEITVTNSKFDSDKDSADHCALNLSKAPEFATYTKFENNTFVDGGKEIKAGAPGVFKNLAELTPSGLKKYDEVNPGELLYTVNFNGDSAFIPGSTGAKDKGHMDYTVIDNGAGVKITNKSNAVSAEPSLWGGLIKDLEATNETIYSMVYKAKAEGNLSKNNSVGVGGWAISETGFAETRGVYNVYANHNTTNASGAADPDQRTALADGITKIGEELQESAKGYVYTKDMSAIDVDADGYVTALLVFDGTTKKFANYYLADGATDLTEEASWIKFDEREMTKALNGTDANYMCFWTYTYYNTINTTIKDVKFYKEFVWSKMATVTVNGTTTTKHTNFATLFAATNRVAGDVEVTLYTDVTVDTAIVIGEGERLTIKAADGLTETPTITVSVSKPNGTTPYKGGFVFASGGEKIAFKDVNIVVEEATVSNDATRTTSLVMLNGGKNALIWGNGAKQDIIFDNVNVTSAGDIINQHATTEELNGYITVNDSTIVANGDFIDASRSTKAELQAFNLTVTGNSKFSVANMYTAPTAGGSYITYANTESQNPATFAFRVTANGAIYACDTFAEALAFACENGPAEILVLKDTSVAQDANVYADYDVTIKGANADVKLTMAFKSLNLGSGKLAFENIKLDLTNDAIVYHDAESGVSEDYEIEIVFKNADITTKDYGIDFNTAGTVKTATVTMTDTVINATENYMIAASTSTITLVADGLTTNKPVINTRGKVIYNLTDITGAFNSINAFTYFPTNAPIGTVESESYGNDATAKQFGYTFRVGETEGGKAGEVYYKTKAEAFAVALTTAKVYDITGTAPAEVTCDHTYSAATCTAKAKCSVCGNETGALANHVDTNKDYKCDACGAACGQAPTTTPPTTTAPTTTAPTTKAPTTTAPKTEEKKGCKGTVTVAGLALVAALGSCAIFVEKKRR